MPPPRPNLPTIDVDRLIAAGYRRRVLVKFREPPSHDYEDALERRFGPALLARWNTLSRGRDDITLVRQFPVPDADTIRWAVEDARSHAQGYVAPDFFSWFALDCPPGVDPHRLAEDLREWPELELAYVQGLPAPPPSFRPVADYSGETLFAHQEYMHAQPAGVDVKRAWTYPGGDGSGVRLADVEQGWYLDHPDLPQGHRVPLLPIGISTSFMGQRHGTSVLGLVLGRPDGTGMVGIAPGVRGQAISTYWKIPSVFGASLLSHSPARALLYAACILGRGDVLLVEDQAWLEGGGGTPCRPLEAEILNFLIIRFAADRGITVVEAAGNGDIGVGTGDLDGPEFGSMFRRSVRDSKAILVSASMWHPSASAGAPGYHERVLGANYGSRVDCFAWGDSIVTLAEPGETETEPAPAWLPTGYMSVFNGTSGAAAIIAGVAACVQGLAAWRLGAPLDPEKLRNILSDEGFGTRALTAAPGTAGSGFDYSVGVMPDLDRVVGQYFRLP